jgi:hypothetical protein
VLRLERPEAANLDAVAANERALHRLEDRIHDLLSSLASQPPALRYGIDQL